MNSQKKTFSFIQKDIKKIIEKGVFEGIFPCAAAGILQGTGAEKKQITTYYGNASIYPQKRKLKKNFYFDLASLTKPLATAMAILCLLKKNNIDLEEKLPALLEKKIKDEKKNITVRQLLSHSSGFPAHREYFKIVNDLPTEKKKDREPTLNSLSMKGFSSRSTWKKIYFSTRYTVVKKALTGNMLLQKIVPGEKKFSAAKYMMTTVMPWVELPGTAACSVTLKA